MSVDLKAKSISRYVRMTHMVAEPMAMTNPMKADGHHSNSAPQTGHSLAMIGIWAAQAPHSAVFFSRRFG